MAGEKAFEVDLGANGGKLVFRTQEDVRAFIDREEAFWAWLSQAPAGQQDVGQRAWNVVYQQIQQLRQVVQTWMAGNPGYEASVEQSFRQAFITAKVPISTSVLGRFIMDLRKRHGDLVAAAAVATAMDQSPLGNGIAWIRGGVELAAFQMGIKPTAAEATLATLKDIENDLGSALRSQTDAASEAQRRHADQMSRHAREADILKRWTARRAERHRKALQQKVDDAVAEFKGTERLYKEQMRIKAPVDYWTAKASEHAAAAAKQLTRLLRFAGIAGVAVLGVLITAALNADKFITANTHLGVLGIYASIGLIMTTVAFWAGRVMVRLYLSEHHLALDARERAVMAQTYLALTAVEKAEEKDRALVLTALFRSSSDGIVKDDGAPDIGIAALASKVVSR